MRQTFLLFWFIFLWATIASADNSNKYKVAELRKLYLKATQDNDAGVSFHKLMNKYEGQNPVVLAYKAASEAAMAKYVWNPYSKLKHLKTSEAIFEEAVKLNKDEPEIRFLRFTVEHYVPRYLNLSKHVEEDKVLIIRSLQHYPKSGLSVEWARTMRDFMLTKDHCTEEEKKILRSITI